MSDDLQRQHDNLIEERLHAERKTGAGSSELAAPDGSAAISEEQQYINNRQPGWREENEQTRSDPRVIKHGWKPSNDTERCFTCRHNALCRSEVNYFMEDYWCAAYQANDKGKPQLKD